MKPSLLLGALLVAGTTLTALSAEVTSKNGTLHGREVFTLENGFVRLSVTPEIGGRVLEFVNLKTGHGSAKVRADNIAKKPDDNWAGADYGGCTDAPVLGLGWPGDFWKLTYALAFEDGKDGSKTIVAKGKSQDIEIERRMTLFPDSTMSKPSRPTSTSSIRKCASGSTASSLRERGETTTTTSSTSRPTG